MRIPTKHPLRVALTFVACGDAAGPKTDHIGSVNHVTSNGNCDVRRKVDAWNLVAFNPRDALASGNEIRAEDDYPTGGPVRLHVVGDGKERTIMELEAIGFEYVFGCWDYLPNEDLGDELPVWVDIPGTNLQHPDCFHALPPLTRRLDVSDCSIEEPATREDSIGDFGG